MPGHSKIGILILIACILAGCGPTIHYLGERYQRSRAIQIFYDEEEIDKPYTVIGRLVHDKQREYSTDRIKRKMVRKAKRAGADALIFTDFNVKRLEHERSDRVVLKAKVVKF